MPVINRQDIIIITTQLLGRLGKNFDIYPTQIRKPTGQQMLLNIAGELELPLLNLSCARLGRLSFGDIRN